jgi:hypothetical protein
MLFNLKGGPELTRLTITDSAGNKVRRAKELYVTGSKEGKLMLELVIDGVSLDVDVEGNETIYVERQLVEDMLAALEPLDPQKKFDTKLIELADNIDYDVEVRGPTVNKVQMDAILADKNE